MSSTEPQEATIDTVRKGKLVGMRPARGEMDPDLEHPMKIMMDHVRLPTALPSQHDALERSSPSPSRMRSCRRRRGRLAPHPFEEKFGRRWRRRRSCSCSSHACWVVAAAVKISLTSGPGGALDSKCVAWIERANVEACSCSCRCVRNWKRSNITRDMPRHTVLLSVASRGVFLQG